MALLMVPLPLPLLLGCAPSVGMAPCPTWPPAIAPPVVPPSARQLPALLPTCLPPAAADYTNTFRSLSSIPPADSDSAAAEAGLPPALAEVLGPLDEVGTSRCCAAAVLPLWCTMLGFGLCRVAVCFAVPVPVPPTLPLGRSSLARPTTRSYARC
jgi:hypothetical protein